MEEHFLAQQMPGEPAFEAKPWYNPFGDCIVYKIVDEAGVADRIDEVLTIYRSAIDNRPIGFQIKGVCAIVNKFGFDGLTVTSESDDDGVKTVSIAALLLAAYEEGHTSLGRRRGYAEAMGYLPSTGQIRADELQPA